MGEATKNLLRAVLILAARVVCSPFFDRGYLKGKYFDNSLLGWRWAARSILTQRVLGFNRHVPWPVSPFTTISDPANLVFSVDDISNFQGFGCYFQNFNATIRIGRGTYIGPNVGLICSNHDIMNLDEHLDGRDIKIGEKCWLGMNSVILPGVELGDRTIVGAGAVVRHSFPQGNCVIVGVPAKIVRVLPPIERATTESEE